MSQAEAPPPGDLYFRQMLVGQMQNLCYVVGSRSARQALIVDPAWTVDAILDKAEGDGMEIVGALVTHYHQDHVGGSIFGMDIEGVPRLLERAPMPLHVNENEAEGTKKVTGASESDLERHEAGDEIVVGQISIRLLHTPGHTPGSQCFLVEERGQPLHGGLAGSHSSRPAMQSGAREVASQEIRDRRP